MLIAATVSLPFTLLAQQGKVGVDELLASPESYLGKNITVEGYCSHTCPHGSSKMFVRGEGRPLRVETGALGKLEKPVAKHNVSVEGVLKEQRIDEAYLSNWEKRLSAKKESCDSRENLCAADRKAHGGESTAEKTIAAYRKKIEERKAAEGKDYVSIYYFESSNCEVKE